MLIVLLAYNLNVFTSSEKHFHIYEQRNGKYLLFGSHKKESIDELKY